MFYNILIMFFVVVYIYFLFFFFVFCFRIFLCIVSPFVLSLSYFWINIPTTATGRNPNCSK